MPWGLIAGALVGSTVTGLHSTRAARKTNEQAIAAGERSDTLQAQLERERLAEETRLRNAELAEIRAAREAQLQRDRERWQDYLRVNEPIWRAGAGVLGSLYDIAGFGGGAAPAYAAPSSTPPPSTGLPPAGTTGAPPMRGGDVGMGGAGLADLMAGTAGVPMRRPLVRPQPAKSFGRRAQLVGPSAPHAPSLQDLMALASMTGRGGRDRIGQTIGS